MIHYQPYPKVPPIGFFEPISVDPRDMMTDVEFLLGILKKLNEVIAQVNQDSQYIAKIAEIEAEIIALREELTQFETDVNNTIAIQFANIKVELQSMIAAALQQANAYTDAKTALLEEEIQDISVGQITLYDPTTGVISPLQTVINNLFDSGREDALTASEYDALELTATAYDAYQLTAADYDSKGKSLLV